MDDDTTTTTKPATAPAPALSPLGSKLGNLKERRREVVEKQVLERRVPRWSDPYIWVRYAPVDHAIIRAGFSRIEKASPQNKSRVEIEANTDLLIRACTAVYAKLDTADDAPEYSLRLDDWEGEPTRFDPDLAANLGLDDKATARQVVKALFIVEGDILAHARALSEFSGYTEEEADDDLAGE